MSIRLEITFHGIDYVSDRTAREVFKSVSKLMRRVQSAEVVYVLRRANLPLDQLQSLSDRALDYLEDAPLLNIKEAHQGSWKIVAAVGTFGLWFLSVTVGESITDGWKKTELHETIVEYIGSIRAEKLIDLIRGNFDEVSSLDEWDLRNIELKTSKKGPRLILHLAPLGIRRIEKREFVDDDVLMRRIEKLLDET